MKLSSWPIKKKRVYKAISKAGLVPIKQDEHGFSLSPHWKFRFNTLSLLLGYKIINKVSIKI